METFVLRGTENESSYDLASCVEKKFKVKVKDIKFDFPDNGIMYTYYDKQRNLKLEEVTSPFLILNGSGHYHQRTYFVLKALKRKCSYLHVDAHSDTAKKERLGCGSFVLDIIDLGYIENANLIGVKVTSENGDRPAHTGYNNMRIYGPSCWADFGLNEFSIREVKGDAIYLSVDLDVAKGVMTDFPGNETMAFNELCELFKKIIADGRLIGADICGLADMRRQANAVKYKESLEKLVDLCSIFVKAT